MASDYGGNWTKDKLQILEEYLKAYTTALKRQNFRLIYVDPFAGWGYVNLNQGSVSRDKPPLSDTGWDEESVNLLKGSTRLALEVKDRPFDKFIFIEKDPDNAAKLIDLKGGFPDRDIEIFREDANKFLQDWCQSQKQRLGIPWQGERAVIFLDPFATEVDWETIQRISETESVDLWILFPLSALTRMLPKGRAPYEATAANLDRIFGNREWQDNLYKTSSQQSLFDDDTRVVRYEQQAIVDFYLSKLKGIFPVVAEKPRWFRISNNSPLFVLMFAAANPKGKRIALRIANHLLNRW